MSGLKSDCLPVICVNRAASAQSYLLSVLSKNNSDTFLKRVTELSLKMSFVLAHTVALSLRDRRAECFIDVV
jgi:hypothetical protein